MNREEIPHLYLKMIGRDPEEIAIPNRRGKHLKRKYSTNIEVVSALYNTENVQGAAEALGYAQTRGKGSKGLEKALREKCAYLFEEKISLNRYFHFINNFCGYHWCNAHKKLEKVERFTTLQRKEGLARGIEYHDRCKEEYMKHQREALKKYRKTPKGRATKNYHTAKRRAAKYQQTPRWANEERIKEMYSFSSKEVNVDHIIPLIHPLVCGLHCEDNLKPIPAKENLKKHNKFYPMSYEHEFLR